MYKSNPTIIDDTKEFLDSGKENFEDFVKFYIEHDYDYSNVKNTVTEVKASMSIKQLLNRNESFDSIVDVIFELLLNDTTIEIKGKSTDKNDEYFSTYNISSFEIDEDEELFYLAKDICDIYDKSKTDTYINNLKFYGDKTYLSFYN